MNEPVPFHLRRRQQFLGEARYLWALNDAREGINNIQEIIEEAVTKSDYRYAAHRASFQGLMRFQRLCVQYTAGEPIKPLRAELESVVAAYERYSEYLGKHTGDRNDWVFDFDDLDAYCQLMQLVGLCFLLHRRDLLPRIAALQDGINGSNGGADVVFEEFMCLAVGTEIRYQTEHAYQVRPYENLFYALTEDLPSHQLKELNLFLKHWYKDLAGAGWHDSHKPNENGDQGGYYGYWSFEAGAAVLLLGIEDDSSLHKYLYYPKDLVAWARGHTALSAEATTQADLTLRCPAGEPCPRAGWWFSPARPDSRRRVDLGALMPELGGDYGRTVWQWDASQ